MLDTLAAETYKPVEPLLAPEQVQRIDRVTRPVDAVGAFDRLLSVYDATERLQPRGYNGGLDRFIEDLTLDITDVPKAARRVLAMAQKSLTEPELKAVFNVFQQAKGFWRGLLTNTRIQLSLDSKDMRGHEKRLLELSQYQQRLAQLVYSVGCMPEDTAENNTLELMQSFIGRLSDRTGAPILNRSQDLIDGAFVQAALMRTFQDHGYFILVPDPKNIADMQHLDMRGVDFVAISEDGELLLVDSKGNKKSHEPYVRKMGISRGVPDYIFKSIQKDRKALEGNHVGLDIVLGRKFLHSVPMTQVAIEAPSDSKLLGIGKFRGKNTDDLYMRAITHQLDDIREYETAA